MSQGQPTGAPSQMRDSRGRSPGSAQLVVFQCSVPSEGAVCSRRRLTGVAGLGEREVVGAQSAVGLLLGDDVAVDAVGQRPLQLGRVLDDEPMVGLLDVGVFGWSPWGVV